MAAFSALSKLVDVIPQKFRPWAIGAAVALPVGAFMLFHKKKVTVAVKKAAGKGYSYHGSGIPVSGPEIVRRVVIHTPATLRGQRLAALNWWHRQAGQVRHHLHWNRQREKAAQRGHNNAWLQRLRAHRWGLNEQLTWIRRHIATITGEL